MTKNRGVNISHAPGPARALKGIFSLPGVFVALVISPLVIAVLAGSPIATISQHRWEILTKMAAH